jgi:Fic/DOC family
MISLSRYFSIYGASIGELRMGVFEDLMKAVKELQRDKRLPVWPTQEQRADWAFGNTVIENAEVTMEMAERAAARPRSSGVRKVRRRG